MLTVSEILATARAVAPDAEITNRSTQERVPLPEVKASLSLTDADRQRLGPAKRTISTLEDRPEVEVAFAGDVLVRFHVDRLDPAAPRWLATTTDDGQHVAEVVVHGAGGVTDAIAQARELAGLPEPTRPAQASNLTFGG